MAMEFSDGEKARGTASKIVKAAAQRDLLILTAGARETIRR